MSTRAACERGTWPKATVADSDGIVGWFTSEKRNIFSVRDV